MANCELDVCIRSKYKMKTMFTRKRVTFNMKVKKDKPKKITHFQSEKDEFDIFNRNQADLYIRKPHRWRRFEEVLEHYRFKKPAISCMIKFYRSLDVKPKDLWVNMDTCKLVGRKSVKIA